MSVYTLFLIYSSAMGSPYVATGKKRIEEILKEANLKKGKTFVELGCGDGRIVRTAVKHYNVKGVGIDINPLLIFWAKILGTNGIQYKLENIFETDLKQSDYIYIFLMPKLIEKLALKMNKEVKKGAIVISHGFPIKGWEKKLIKTLKRIPFSTYFYRVR
ncbi:hypothetical protein COY13_01450 [Candidatus Roizmanbacteria bacterium CG_4_10_14_0_2_um_filter_36_35]|uniref:Methyltransferase domain-containing protein n=4 Tax=Candidatus Roizmaniibacteriota TaxID=1752723 RepID=A0A2M7BW96_9BACT|nr:MAG: hypothetical protein COV86_02990 [Candidatus Roizmanbacteria bacterium CG11_big_fil_rev_8_21_14_0_20_35_14]PIV10837.1 MAG: hypothetical protein COS50_03235 [Candidatus Roizmanbacteria bacterium CG03_land_8_20_14_0_80_35_26]PIZ68306.1 MAG: hypothetical protein COY13_01450 [Candidatus Roizmanbacteria bacterium CG_4_10_14_0_2_um_filter_36_35]PJC32843.1 MAG: hypothetical protein CO049_01705 [Candidatus Roizmanbacteria bacterium CG_4_9_14_0_2_um_filter_36_12]